MAEQITQAMVLAAGFGKRLHPLTLTTPKPLIAVNGRPLLAYVFDKLVASGIKKIVINTHYLADQIHTFCEHYKGVQIILSHEPELLDNGGGILKALPYFEDKPFLSVNADIWWYDQQPSILESLQRLWNPETMDALLAVVPKHQALHFEGSGDYFQLDSGQLKHRQVLTAAPYIYSGIQLLQASFFAGLPLKPVALPTLYHRAEQHGRLYGHLFQGQWCDIGTPAALQTLNKYLELS